MMKNVASIFETGSHLAGTIIRLTLALVIFPHGCQLLLGWFGGMGFSASMHYFTQVEGLPWMIGFLVIILQSIGSLLILVGLGGRFLALSMIILFIGMIVTSHLEHGFFMNWMGAQKGEGYEYHLLVLGLSSALMVEGSGKYSLDRYLMDIGFLKEYAL